MRRAALLRRTPMRRAAPPARQLHARPHLVLIPRPADAPRGVMASAAGHARAVSKRGYVRSEALMRAYRLIPCQHCGRDDGTVCGAHPNRGDAGKGMGIKADDNLCASLCSFCHRELDQGSAWTEEYRKAVHEAARLNTLIELLRRGLWPFGVPMPATS